MNYLYGILSQYLTPLTSPFFLLGLILSVDIAFRKLNKLTHKVLLPLIFGCGFFLFYMVAGKNAEMAKWLGRLNNPLFAVLAVIVVPAIFLPRGKYYKFFLILPLLAIILAVADIISQILALPEKGFHWFLIRPGYLIAAVAGIIVIAQNFLKLDRFRNFTRATVLVVLLFGGFAFRQNYTDYKSMIERRQNTTPDIMNISETTPVMRFDNRLVYIPSAPCRFASDGGYVQGCIMELTQRIHQINFDKVFAGDPSEVSLLAIALAALLSVTVLAYIGARWWCGWICPLSTIGELFNFLRKLIGFSYLKPTKTARITAVTSGVSLGLFSINLAYLYTKIDKEGKFMGCKIPIYPFCKICPGQMVCPVASMAHSSYFVLPGMEWLFGFFKMGVVALTGFFVIGFMTSRRIFCRFCPMGMFGGVFNRGAMLAIKKDPRKCNGCGICNEVCPMDINSIQKEMVKTDVSCFDCVYCARCIDNCPQDKCLSLEFAGKRIIESDFTKKMNNG